MVLLGRTWRRWEDVYLNSWLTGLWKFGFDTVHAVVKMRKQTTPGYRVNVGKSTHFLSAFVKTSLEFVHHIRVGGL